jgi:hypothetical protein
MLFKYGKKIFDMIMNKARPTFEDEKPVNVFDLWEGANFKIRMRTVEGYPNYDQSAFAEPTPVAPSDEAILAVANRQVKLGEFLEAKNFKSYEELKTKLDSVLSGDGQVPTAEQLTNEPLSVAEPKSFPSAPPPNVGGMAITKAPEINEDDDDVMSFFQKIADEA